MSEIDVYEKKYSKIYEENDTFDNVIQPYTKRIPKEFFKTKRERIFKRTVELLEESDEPIKQFKVDVSGDIQDRLRFLKERIKEVEKAIAERKVLHESVLREIENEIAERNKMLASAGTDEKIRELRLDIMLLMMERRKENVSFWRDMVNLRKELMILLEEYENERKIAKLIGEVYD